MNNIEAVTNYIDIASANNQVVADTLFQRILNESNLGIRLILSVRIYFEFIQITEVVIKIIYIIKNRISFIEGLFIDIDYVKYENEYYREIVKYSGKEYDYFIECLGIDKGQVKNEDPKTLKGLFNGIYSCLKNRTATFKGKQRALIKFYNNIKHGFPIFIKDDKSVKIYLTKKTTATFPIDDNETRKWVKSITAFRITMMNLLHLLSDHYILDQK